MSNNFSEDEQIEKAREWWDKYKYLLLTILVLFSIGILSWDYFKNSSLKTSINASNDFEKFTGSYIEGELPSDEMIDEALRIKNQYLSSGYSDLLALYLAKYYVAKEDTISAEKELRWVLNRASDTWFSEEKPLAEISRIRLIKLLLEDRPQEAIDLAESASIMSAELFELKGDALIKLGDLEGAKINYLEALNSYQSQLLRNIMSMKIADLKDEK